MTARARNAMTVHDAANAVVLCAIALLFLWPAWLQPDSFWYAPGSDFSDLTVTHWPNMWFVRESWRAYHQIPLWRPLIMGGGPFVGNPLAAYFYPLNWLFLILPVTPAFHLLFGLGLIVAGLTCYGLMRWSYQVSPFAALVGGLGYMVTPKLIAHIGAGHVGLCQAFSWAPLLLWLLRSAVGRRCAYRAAWCGTMLAIVFFADPRVAFYDALLLACYALYRVLGLWRVKGGRHTLGTALRLVWVPAAFGMIGAAQLLPTLELMAATTRATLTLHDAGYDSLPWPYLLGYVIANWGGYHEWMTYLGLAPLGLALFGIWQGKAPDRRFWTGLLVVALLFALGVNGPLYPLLFRLFPALGWVRVPPRALLFLILAANILSAWGVDLVLAWPYRSRQWAARLGLAGLVLCGALGLGFVLVLGRAVPASVLAFAVVGTVWMGLWLSSVRRFVPGVVVKSGLFALVVIDLWLVRSSLLELRPAQAVLGEGDAVARFLSEQDGLFRVYSPSYSIRQHVGARHGTQQLDGVDPSQIRWMAQFMALVGGYPLDGYGVTIPYFPHSSDVRTVWQDAVPDAVLLGLLNGRFVVAEFDLPGFVLRTQIGSSRVYENERTMPRAFLITQTQSVTGWQEAQTRLATGFDPTAGALVEGGAVLSGPAGWQEAQISYFSPNRIVVHADLTQAALLVLGEVWYPGWQAVVDGIEQPVHRVDGVLRGVYLEPGEHTIVWQYRPVSLRLGIAISLIALLGLAVAGIATRAKKRAGL